MSGEFWSGTVSHYAVIRPQGLDHFTGAGLFSWKFETPRCVMIEQLEYHWWRLDLPFRNGRMSVLLKCFTLTHRAWDKMATISPTALSNAFSWIGIILLVHFIFLLKSCATLASNIMQNDETGTWSFERDKYQFMHADSCLYPVTHNTKSYVVSQGNDTHKRLYMLIISLIQSLFLQRFKPHRSWLSVINQ